MQKNDDYFVFTSNVDGHFLRAGFPEENIVECHGSINHFQCLNDICGHVWEENEADFVVDIETMHLMSEVPTCLSCGNPARPNILMFDDFSWNSNRNKNQQNSFTKWNMMPMRGHYNVAGANKTSTWQTGYPYAVDYARG